MKAHFWREIRQPIHGGLQTGNLPTQQRIIQRGRTTFGLGEFAHIQLHTEGAANVFDDAARGDAVGNQGHAVELDHGQIHKSERVSQPEHHGFVHGAAVVGEKGRHHAAFAVGGVLVGEGSHDVGVGCGEADDT